MAAAQNFLYFLIEELFSEGEAKCSSSLQATAPFQDGKAKNYHIGMNPDDPMNCR